MYIERVPNRGSRPAILLRSGWREGGQIRKRTLANLTDWPLEKIEALRRLLKNEPLVSPREAFEVERTTPHGHVEAVLGTLRRLELDTRIASKPSRQRALVLGMIAEQVLHPCSKLAATRLWHTTTLAEELAIADADEDELYEAMDWLLARQARIEQKLAARHLAEGSQVLYDVSSSYYEGRTCPLAEFGHDRDGKHGKPIIVYGVLADREGRPIAVQVYPGHTGDPTTVPDQVKRLRERFGLEWVVLVGDRGMLTQTQIERLREHPGLGWISALRFEAVRRLADQGSLQLSLFDRPHLLEITSPDFPGERLIACYNPLLAEERRRKRQALLAATEDSLERIAREVARRTRTPLSAAEIGQKVGRVLHRYKMGKHFEREIAAGVFRSRRKEESIQREAALDGLYIVRTSEPAERLSADDAVRSYKNLAQVERIFRGLKGLELLIRPIRHREARRVRAHIFLCLLAYYVEWHMRQALAPLLFEDEQLASDRAKRHPVAKATPSVSAQRKKIERTTPDGWPVHSFRTLLAALATRCRNRCRVKSDPEGPTFEQITPPNPLQERALQLLGLA